MATRLDPNFRAHHITGRTDLAFTTGCHDRLSDVELIDLFRQQLRVMREWRNSISADITASDITASQERIKQSRVMLAQVDEQINQMERELGWFGGRSERALLP
jgi:hypothetical protein